MQYINKQTPQGCLIKECANGNEDAFKVAATLYVYIDWLDNVVDGDIKTNLAESAKVSLNLLLMLSFNPFYQEHKEKLAPVLLAAYNAWQMSDLCEQHDDYRVRVAADVLKGYFLQVFYVIAFITGGPDLMNHLREKWCGFDFDAKPDLPKASSQVVPNYPWKFPEDHGAHPEYPIEWWYAAGVVSDGEKDLGVHVARFRLNGTWRTHFSIHDPATGRGFHTTTEEETVWEYQAPNRFVFRGKFPQVGVELEFKMASEVVLQGAGGYSKKSDRPGHASQYYSIPSLRVSGTVTLPTETVTLPTETVPLSGRMWMDHEFGSPLKPRNFRWAFFFAPMECCHINGYILIENGEVNLDYSRCAWVHRDGSRKDLTILALTGTPTVDSPDFIVHTTDGDIKVGLLPTDKPTPFDSDLGTYLEQPCKVTLWDGFESTGYLEITT